MSPYRSTWEPAGIFIEHNGVKVYHAYDDQDAEARLVFHFATGSHDEMVSEELEDFDVRDLATYQASPSHESAAYQAIKAAIDQGFLTSEGLKVD